MTTDKNDDIAQALLRVREADRSGKVLGNAAEAFQKATDEWERERKAGHGVSAAQIRAAQAAAVWVSLIADGLLFLTSRAPEGCCQVFGALGQLPMM